MAGTGVPFFELGKKGASQLWVFVAGLALLLLAYWVAPEIWFRLKSVFVRIFINSDTGSNFLSFLTSSQVGVFLDILVTYCLGPVFVLVALRAVQNHVRKRPMQDLMSTAPKFRWHLAIKAAMIYMFVTSLVWFVKSFFADWGGVTWIFEPKNLVLWPALVLGVALFIFAEEAVFRGFICQGLSVQIKSPLLVMVLSSLLYVAWSSAGYYMAFGWQSYLLVMFIVGMAACLLVVMTGGLEATIAIGTTSALIGTLLVSDQTLGLPQYSLYSAGETFYTAVSVFETAATYAITLILCAYILPQKKETK